MNDVVTCRYLSEFPIGQFVRLVGKVQNLRCIGKIAFIRLYDGTGSVQVFVPTRILGQCQALKVGHVVVASGTLSARAEKDARADEVNGGVEIIADSIDHKPTSVIPAELRVTRQLASANDTKEACITALRTLGFSDVSGLRNAFSIKGLAERRVTETALFLIFLAQNAQSRWYFHDGNDLLFGYLLVEGRSLEADLDTRVRGLVPASKWREGLAGLDGDPDVAAFLQVFSKWDYDGISAVEVSDALSLAVPFRAVRVSFDELEELKQAALECETKLTISGLDARISRCLIDYMDAPLKVEMQGSVTDTQRHKDFMRQMFGPFSKMATMGSEMGGGPFEQYQMRSDDVRWLTNVFPHWGKHVHAAVFEDGFQKVWSILGNDSVAAMLRDPAARSAIQSLVKSGFLRDAPQLIYLTCEAVTALEDLLSRHPWAEGELRRLFAQKSEKFATLIHSMVRYVDDVDIDNLFLAISRGAWTPVMVGVAVATIAGDLASGPLVGPDLHAHYDLLTNKAVDLRELGRRYRQSIEEGAGWALPVSDWQCGAELIYLLYSPNLLSLPEASGILLRARDCTADWEKAGIRFAGSHWNDARSCYDFGRYQLVPSKNVGSVLGKGAAGICSVRDVDLFNDPLHFHLNLVDSKIGNVCGNVQLYKHNDDALGACLIVRGVNPSAHAVNNGNAAMLLRNALVAVLELAQVSTATRVFVPDAVGVRNADSGRSEIRGIMSDLLQFCRKLKLAQPLRLFNFQGEPIGTDTVYEIWSR